MSFENPFSEVDRLAHKIAIDAAAALIDSYSIPVTEGEETWQDISEPSLDVASCFGEDGLIDELRYLELRGALIRHPNNPDWIQIGEPIEA
jgi:hypothetical protein